VTDLQTLDEFRGHPGDALSYARINAHISKPDDIWVVSLMGLDTDEEVDGFSKEEINEIILYLEHISNRLDTMEKEEEPNLFDTGEDDAEEETNSRGMG